MSYQNLTDPALLPEPDWIPVPSHEELMDEMRAEFLAENPDLMTEVEWESTFTRKQHAMMATREIRLRMMFNKMFSEFTLAYGQDIGPAMIGDNFEVKRRVITESDDQASPPVPTVYEPLGEFKKRIRLANTASFFGHETSYQFWGMLQDPAICDISVIKPKGGCIDVYILVRDGTGSPNDNTMKRMNAYFHNDDWEGIVDVLTVNPAEIITGTIEAELILLPGPHQARILEEAKTSLNKLLERDRQLGADLTCDMIKAALMVPGVYGVNLISPTADLIAENNQFVFIESANIEMGGENA